MNGGWTDPYIDSSNTNAGIGTGSIIFNHQVQYKTLFMLLLLFPSNNKI